MVSESIPENQLKGSWDISVHGVIQSQEMKSKFHNFAFLLSENKISEHSFLIAISSQYFEIFFILLIAN